MKRIYGPVPSRRLGLSLGLDIVPFKTCTLSCVYCQLGRTTRLTALRKRYVAAGEVLKELRGFLAKGGKADYITFSGSGEPTLNSSLGDMIAGIRKMTSVPVCVITNGTLLYDKKVRKDLSRADLVIPSLDAVSPRVFRKVNRPAPALRIEKIMKGLVKFSRIFRGKIWLEIMLVKGVNDTPSEIKKLKEAVRMIRPDKIHINTPVRPPAALSAKPPSGKRLREIVRILGRECEVICERHIKKKRLCMDANARAILSIMRRRPVTVRDIVSSLGIDEGSVVKELLILVKLKKIKAQKRNRRTYYTAH